MVFVFFFHVFFCGRIPVHHIKPEGKGELSKANSSNYSATGTKIVRGEVAVIAGKHPFSCNNKVDDVPLNS